MALERGRPSRDQSALAGFALIIVLWTLVLIGFITSHILATARIETKIAGNLVANAAAEAAAEGAVYQAIFGLLDPHPEASWKVGEPARELTIGDYRVAVQVRDEAAYINPNSASPVLIEALLQVTGTDAASARRVATAIKEWIGLGDARKPSETVVEAYRAAGLNYGPPAEPMQTLDELRYVLGMTPKIYAAIRPHLSLFAPPDPDLAQAGAVVAAAIRATGQSRAASVPAGARETNTVRIVAEAQSAKARTLRTAIVELETWTRTYKILAWYDDFE